MTAIDGRIYLDGRRIGNPCDLQDAVEAMRQSGAVGWIGLTDPDPVDLESVAATFGLHPLAVEDARKGHQRAKLERYGDTLFVVLRPAWYDDGEERVEFGEVHLFVGPNFVITVRHEARLDLTTVRDALEADSQFLSIGPEAMLTAFLDEIVDGDTPVVAGVEADIDEVEDSLFSDGDVDPALSERIYRLLEQVIAFQRAIGPLPAIVRGLLSGAEKFGTDNEVQNRLRNVLDHTIRVSERVESCRALLNNALTVHSTLVSLEQNDAMRRLSNATFEQGEEVKKISSWAAILFTPTLVASTYGMNFDHMPELHWMWGYPFALALMVGLGVGLWGVFKWRHWL
ncbi:magnesium and cobalt transport protein CorA [Nocardia sp. FBN12]|uniref:magnesium and cobalt transport protein CorA n=1 Tax=Nocardia sp. FBN12 TaxID=3419766 RepID=UPI003D00409E